MKQQVSGDTERGDAWDFFPWTQTMQTIHSFIDMVMTCVLCEAQAGAAEHTTDLGNCGSDY